MNREKRTALRSDLIAHVEAAIDTWTLWKMDALVRELVEALKKSHREVRYLRLTIIEETDKLTYIERDELDRLSKEFR